MTADSIPTVSHPCCVVTPAGTAAGSATQIACEAARFSVQSNALGVAGFEPTEGGWF